MNKRQAVFETKKHIRLVRDILHKIVINLIERGGEHDSSKLVEPELSIFLKYTPKLRKVTYGSDEYKLFLKGMKPALDHHYRVNRHHPEHFKDGIDGMNLLDLLEMFVDWYAATKRHEDGDIRNSIKINTERFNISEQLVNILNNTVEVMED